MENQLNIRKLTLNDLESLQTLGKQTFFETFVGTCSDEDMQHYLENSFNLTQLESELKNEEMHFYVAEQQGEMLGYLKVNFGAAQTELQDPSAVEIQRIYVLNQYHGKGVGQVLYRKALKLAEQHQADYIWLGVWEHNYKAQNFYRKNGFVKFDKHTFMMGTDPQTDIMMKKTLK
ncbi:GNAT family N-acetyltransferase [Rodentibacter caecimuris]|uniref:GNAT family N-acetyltransferase n=1 Tax=Rodentibacter caecimuris TaxID=1796644 RepID=A0A9X8VX15_9PAST|nr:MULTISPECIES: GNAT family N-acetyltransferase [Pasteurellaceae]AOF54045.1 Acetyltransferase, GNAT family [Pasteurellaceae bacterium NI1060]MCQ9124665.1 GNAT family N-acetyltransferase [Rodentibacter heylii]MCR1837476.1 GNAT family N-acetyltransferase [Pasteurella caecimuris]MCU0106888.1 GNAT family N-acetyltransferase [Pasteurella caecimuris]OOF72745.1 GNAT family N-acetyltransferase [Rodentibacter heylii]